MSLRARISRRGSCFLAQRLTPWKASTEHYGQSRAPSSMFCWPIFACRRATGLDLLALAQQLSWDCSVILMTGHAELITLSPESVCTPPISCSSPSASTPFSILFNARLRNCNRPASPHRTRFADYRLHERTEQLEPAQHLLSDSYRATLETLVATLEVARTGHLRALFPRSYLRSSPRRRPELFQGRFAASATPRCFTISARSRLATPSCLNQVR